MFPHGLAAPISTTSKYIRAGNRCFSSSGSSVPSCQRDS